MRFAMEAGGGIIVPLIIQRSRTNLVDMWVGAPTGLDYLFDEENLVTNIRSACPQMPVYETLEAISKDGEAEVLGLLNMEADLLHGTKFYQIGILCSTADFK